MTGELLCVAIESRPSIPSGSINNETVCTARELTLLTIENSPRSGTGFDCILLLLARAVREAFVLRELEVDQSRANDQHPKANKSRDEKCAAWRDIRSGF